MYRTALRSAARPLLRPAIRSTSRRWASTAPADRPRTWRSSALRWGVAIGAVYYYNTAPAFMDSDALEARRTVEAPSSFDDADLPTVDSVLEEKRKQIQSKLDDLATPSPKETTSENVSPTTAGIERAEGSPQALEDEAGAQGAFNPETGEINWDCPCLGGMASGPCGEDFKTAFSCFVYSDQEPKGMECIDKFQGMQECFRKYPEIYGAELADEEDGEAPQAPAAEGFEQSDNSPIPNGASTKQTSASAPDLTLSSPKEPEPAALAVEKMQESATPDEPSKLPKWEDATGANKEVQDKEKEKESKKEESK